MQDEIAPLLYDDGTQPVSNAQPQIFQRNRRKTLKVQDYIDSRQLGNTACQKHAASHPEEDEEEEDPFDDAPQHPHKDMKASQDRILKRYYDFFAQDCWGRVGYGHTVLPPPPAKPPIDYAAPPASKTENVPQSLSPRISNETVSNINERQLVGEGRYRVVRGLPRRQALDTLVREAGELTEVLGQLMAGRKIPGHSDYSWQDLFRHRYERFKPWRATHDVCGLSGGYVQRQFPFAPTVDPLTDGLGRATWELHVNTRPYRHMHNHFWTKDSELPRPQEEEETKKTPPKRPARPRHLVKALGAQYRGKARTSEDDMAEDVADAVNTPIAMPSPKYADEPPMDFLVELSSERPSESAMAPAAEPAAEPVAEASIVPTGPRRVARRSSTRPQQGEAAGVAAQWTQRGARRVRWDLPEESDWHHSE